ncbi:4'-phosphopantetheinyl transferase superfamily protein [Lewinella sp. 4G2]|uniref:4'-phosphopantetheinyl transferase family protein n=1 Tax=Lewinella sp. 4G2 TaxID=1803372 RepID=UPI0007B4CED3|nr:4'-phosphopantetheinyl transferase superfamily protein [Lewinella sp. 4G2]OAV44349.1 hypothetical protein A3850_007505 [Lewinella sp. 4G2]
MPIQFHETLSAPGEWGLFHITEAEEELAASVPLFPLEQEQIDRIKGSGQRREYLAARLLLHKMSGRHERGELYKDNDGKPHLANSHFHVSISHTVNYAAAVAHPDPCGIDVQRIVTKIERIAPRFISDAEFVQIKNQHRIMQMHLIWSAKEAMYKAFGKRELDFREHLYVDFGNYQPGQTTASAMLRKGPTEMVFNLHFRYLEEAVVVACIELRPPAVQ